MPIYMDRHDIPDVTAKDVAEAHQEDLKIQNNYDCRALTYWFDEERGMAFCLIEAPNQASVQNLHNHAHGLIPNQIIEVEATVVEAFLGRIEDPEDQKNSDLRIINDPAFRAIMLIDLNEFIQISAKLGTDEAFNILQIFKEMFRGELSKYNGLSVEHSDEYFIASFTSVAQSVLCALAIQQCLREYDYSISNYKSQARISLSAGVPVSGDDIFFGSTMKLAKRLCFITPTGQIMVASAVNDLYKAQKLNIKGEENSISVLSPANEKFLSHIMDIIEANDGDAAFDVEAFRKQMGMSKSQLYRRITSVTGYSPNDFIKEYRLKKAIKLIEKQKGNISEIAYDAGFSSLSYFSKCFQKRFAVLPSDYANAIA